MRMKRNIETLTIIRERINSDGKLFQEGIASVPFISSVHPLKGGKILDLTVVPYREGVEQKCIVKGNVLPTIQKPGRPRRRVEKPEARRVVIVPKYEGKSVSQDNGINERIVFLFEKRSHGEVYETLAAD